jgi:predicted adenine nucleotide alpha hydrolase (AANH) superfamily ATPase
MRALREAGHSVQGLYYNPNIHPLAEHNLRLESLKKLLEHTGTVATIVREYEIEEYFRRVAYRESDRCAACYHLRLERTARVAANQAFDAFTTTLLVSPYQKHELIREIGQRAATEYGIEFFYEDFRPGWSQTYGMARELELYRQKYCGCIYSEKERFASFDE